MKTIAIPVLIFVLAVVVAGCGSDPTLPDATSGADVETPTVTSTRDISSAGQAASTRTTPDPSGEAGQMSDAGPTSRPEPTVAPATPIPSPTAPAATLATPTRTAEPVSTSTPSVVRVSRSSLERETAPDVSEGDLETLVEGNNTFAFDLYHSLVDAEGNLFFRRTASRRHWQWPTQEQGAIRNARWRRRCSSIWHRTDYTRRSTPSTFHWCLKIPQAKGKIFA